MLTGDFNTLAPGELPHAARLPARLRALLWLSGGRVRWRTIKLVLEAGYTDAYRALHPGGRGFTFPVRDPHVRLDYVFASRDHASRVRSCEVVITPATANASVLDLVPVGSGSTASAALDEPARSCRTSPVVRAGSRRLRPQACTGDEPLMRALAFTAGRWTVDAWSLLEDPAINGSVRVEF